VAWLDYAGFGWLALRVPEADGGLAADAGALAPLMEAVGARLLMEPILASAVIGTGLVLKCANPAQQAAWLPRLAAGSLKLAFAHHEMLDAAIDAGVGCECRQGALHGTKLAVLHGDCADALIVSAKDSDANGGVALYMVDAGATGVERQCFPLLDGRGAANLRLNGARAERLNATTSAAADAAAIAATLQEAAVALCGEALGAIHALNAATNQYLKMRRQFGRPIGANQALQHRMVEMYMLEQEVRAVTVAAQRALRDTGAKRRRVVAGARAFTCGAARRVAAEAVQMHGGMGVSDELDISHYYRRLMVVGTLFGNRDYHLDQFAAACDREHDVAEGPP
jgi:alkylation response protein AidB-like acyl-CoA dehydrogenase